MGAGLVGNNITLAVDTVLVREPYVLSYTVPQDSYMLLLAYSFYGNVGTPTFSYAIPNGIGEGANGGGVFTVNTQGNYFSAPLYIPAGTVFTGSTDGTGSHDGSGVGHHCAITGILFYNNPV